jgi:4-hydroxybenzoate polyprenyltransferase
MAANKNYPTIRFVLRYGHAVAMIAGLLIVLFGLWAGATGAGWVHAVALVLAGLLAYLMLRAFAELVDVVADTLLPPE